MKISDILGVTNAGEIVKKITATKDAKHSERLKILKNEWDVETHEVITSKKLLEDKNIKNAKGDIVKTKAVNRQSVPYQKMIVERAVAFGFANDVQIEYDTNLTEAQTVVDTIEAILHKIKESTFNRKIARDLYRSTEVAEVWFAVKNEKTSNAYGYETPYRFKAIMISPWNGNTLYPIFDEFGDMILFARTYLAQNISGKPAVKMQVWTVTEIATFVQSDSVWTQESSEVNALGKIPVVYATQERAEWEDVRVMIQRLEVLLSKHAEINDYHASPKTFVKGEVSSLPQAGEANPVLKGGADTDIKVLSWADSPESVKLEIETLIENIHKFTQTADISFKSVKGLSQISGVMLKMLFMDVHLKIMAKNEIWDEYFTRRYNLIKSFVRGTNTSWTDAHEDVELTPKITPFNIQDLKEIVEIAMTANGNQAVLGREASIKLTGLADDAKAEMQEILKQESEAEEKAKSEITEFNF